MKTATSIFIVISLLVSVIGFAAMCHDMGTSHEAFLGGSMDTSCFIAMVGITCQTNSVAMAIHHIAAYNAFSQVPIMAFFLAIAALVILYIFEEYYRNVLAYAQVSIPHEYLQRRKKSKYHNNFEQNIIRWLSQFELSPSFV